MVNLPSLGNLSPRQTVISIVAGMAGAAVVGVTVPTLVRPTAVETPPTFVASPAPSMSPTPSPSATPADTPAPTAAPVLAAPVATPAPAAAPTATPSPVPTSCSTSPHPASPSGVLMQQSGAGDYSGSSFTAPSDDGCGGSWIYTNVQVAAPCNEADGQWMSHNSAETIRFGGAVNGTKQWLDVAATTYSWQIDAPGCSWTATIAR